MKKILFLLVYILLISCNDKSNKETKSIEVITEEIIVDEKKKTPKVTFPILAIELNPRYTWEENIYAIWNHHFGEALDKIDYIFELSELEGREGIFIICTKDDTTNYYTLAPGKEGKYELNIIQTSSISVLHQYGNVPTSTFKPYDVSIDYGEQNGVVVSYEVYGMKGAPDEDGMIPFQKIQHDYMKFNEEGNLEYSISETERFNKRNGVEMEEDSSLEIHQFLFQKYYSPIDKSLKSHLLDQILDDMNIMTTSYDKRDNIFEPVRKQDNGTFVNDLANLGYEAFVIPFANDMNLEHLHSSNYPLLYIEDHGSYFYSITDVKIEDKEIIFNLKRILHIDENGGDLDRSSGITTYIDMMNIEGKWVMIFNSDRLMMEKDRKQLETINSNEGE
ncbi:hypothetical protein [Flammeovirga sp. SJP92]|uniref:hypothetical protein n=1 Tax=Flammeovirga sp. SJP92 TaxID=1775430 RepID=UPI0007877F46|nr:hypothetical protein [Flammeovirga sp. SJP92]KXX68736.1 hypothetical protein AVL50_18870 [Flammeovirga sp. SJP92]